MKMEITLVGGLLRWAGKREERTARSEIKAVDSHEELREVSGSVMQFGWCEFLPTTTENDEECGMKNTPQVVQIHITRIANDTYNHSVNRASMIKK